RANHNARLAIFKNFEEMFYKILKKDREFQIARWPYLIKVRDIDVDGKTMIAATFKQRTKGEGGQSGYGMVVQAKRARIHFDMDHGVARVYLDGAEVMSGGKHDDVALINNNVLEIPIPDTSTPGFEKRIQEWTTADMIREQANFRRLIARERKR